MMQPHFLSPFQDKTERKHGRQRQRNEKDNSYFIEYHILQTNGPLLKIHHYKAIFAAS
jgi:hypothetical protein